MRVVDRPEQVNVTDVYVDLDPLLGLPMLLKLEQLNLAGSIKLKAATALVDEAERMGALGPGALMVTSSSGNLGIALAVIAAGRGYAFHCVTDSRCNPVSLRTMRAHGAQVEVVTRPHPTGGLLQARIDRVAEVVAATPGSVLIDQYRSAANPGAHERLTGPELLAALPRLDLLFVGVGTAGTAMGVARHLRDRAPHVRVVGIDSVGSVSFGGPASPRHIPGLGSGVRPAQLDMDLLHDHLYVPEVETVATCRRLAGRGFLLGGSTGTVLAGARRWLTEHGLLDGADRPAFGTVAAISPDGGDRYLETVYAPAWTDERWPETCHAAPLADAPAPVLR